MAARSASVAGLISGADMISEEDMAERYQRMVLDQLSFVMAGLNTRSGHDGKGQKKSPGG
jgi:hypothetical protein